MAAAPPGIKMLILDVDGVLTDGSIILDDDGREFKAFHSRDGLGFHLLHLAGISVALLSGRTAEVVARRARQLHIDEVHQGAGDKLAVYRGLLEKHGLSDAEVCYMGDDLIDLAVMRRVGFAAAPADAHPLVRAAAHFVAPSAGGRGAVRDTIEELLKAAGAWPALLETFDP
ncbi:MAG: HAD-IIIA family hydrolase [Planctomycetes bacterium]|nr:HAD-IIIA family hydrolase [Planctomycetota bacterium]